MRKSLASLVLAVSCSAAAGAEVQDDNAEWYDRDLNTGVDSSLVDPEDGTPIPGSGRTGVNLQQLAAGRPGPVRSPAS